MIRAAILIALAGAPDGGVDPVAVAIRRIATAKIAIVSIDERNRVIGTAQTHEDVADFIRAISSLVTTPRGFGRVLERKQASATVRVELFDAKATVDFAQGEVSAFEAELVRAELRHARVPVERVGFELNVRAR